MVCRVFQKSAGVKKYPSSNHARAVNPYSLEIGPNMVPPPMIQLGDPAAHFLYGRHYMSSAELAEVARVLRGSGSTSHSVDLPMQSQLNYPVTAAGGGFTISGLNLNLGGGGAGTPAPITQPIFRPMQPPPPPAQTLAQVHDVSSNMMMTATSLGAENVGYGAEMSNTNPHGNRYMGMDQCMDLENYWASY